MKNLYSMQIMKYSCAAGIEEIKNAHDRADKRH
jgi:hypothetical protein